MAGRKTDKAGLEPDAAVPPLSLSAVQARLTPHFLEVLGGFDCTHEDGLPDWAQTLLLIGPKEPGYWPHLKAQPEWAKPDPVDQWSRRVIGRLACDLGGKAVFPFGGPPFRPFYRWALQSGQAWESPVKLLVHASQGLLVSFRGALVLRQVIAHPTATRPCDTCAAPCLDACPVGALTGQGYDVPACHAHLTAGVPCMTGGCLVRRACPVSQTYARMAEHSAYHMRQFHT